MTSNWCWTLGRLLFSQDDITKSVKVISGGEQGRMLFGRLMLQKQRDGAGRAHQSPGYGNPSNHDTLNLALENYPGTLIFVSHDREFVSSLANRILFEIPQRCGIGIDFTGTYDDIFAQPGVGATPLLLLATPQLRRGSCCNLPYVIGEVLRSSGGVSPAVLRETLLPLILQLCNFFNAAAATL